MWLPRAENVHIQADGACLSASMRMCLQQSMALATRTVWMEVDCRRCAHWRHNLLETHAIAFGATSVDDADARTLGLFLHVRHPSVLRRACILMRELPRPHRWRALALLWENHGCDDDQPVSMPGWTPLDAAKVQDLRRDSAQPTLFSLRPPRSVGGWTLLNP